MVSVIVPCYNQAQYLPEALDSVMAQTHPDWECIIVNDGSPDNTEQVAMGYCNRDSRFKYYKKENGGLSSARNYGIVRSNGEYILPLDADDIIAPEYLLEAVAILEKEQDIKVVYADAELFGVDTGAWYLPKFTFKKLLLRSIIYCSGIYRRADFDKYGGYKEDMDMALEDWDFWIGILKTGGKVYRIPKTYFFYRTKENSMAKSLDMKKYSQVRKTVYRHHEKLYDDTFGDPITLLNMIDEKDKKIKELNDQLKLIKNSKWWKLRELINKKA